MPARSKKRIALRFLRVIAALGAVAAMPLTLGCSANMVSLLFDGVPAPPPPAEYCAPYIASLKGKKTPATVASNGSANGSSNGAANGSYNGKANGSANGSFNGKANGTANGSVHAANGAMNGSANGTVIAAGGAVVAANGAANGTRKSNGNSAGNSAANSGILGSAAIAGAKGKGSVHLPYRQQSCSACHDKTNSTGLLYPKSELCLTCHDDILKKAYAHAPAAAGDCLACHLPHDSALPSLLRVENGRLCNTCHAEQRIFAKLHRNMANKHVSCLECHNPHTGNNRYFLN